MLSQAVFPGMQELLQASVAEKYDAHGLFHGFMRLFFGMASIAVAIWAVEALFKALLEEKSHREF